MGTRVFACKAHENPESEIWGIWEWERHKSVVFVDIKRERSGDYTRVCTTFGLFNTETETDTMKVSGAEGTFVC
jgi:hypothetical protein